MAGEPTRDRAAIETRAGHAVLGMLLALLHENVPFAVERPRLEELYRCLCDKPAYQIPSNFFGVEHEGEALWGENVVESVKEYHRREYPEGWKAIEETHARQTAYVSAVKGVTERLGLGETYGPQLIHELVTSPDGPWRWGWRSTTVRFSLQIDITPSARYETGGPPPLHNPLAKHYHDDRPIPLAVESSDDVLQTTVRDLPDLRRLFSAVLGWLEAKHGLPARRARSDKYRHLARDVRWFYLNRCESKSAWDIYSELVEDNPEAPDQFVIQKGISRVARLLSVLRIV